MFVDFKIIVVSFVKYGDTELEECTPTEVKEAAVKTTEGLLLGTCRIVFCNLIY